jgi:hypothetical protein
MEVFSEVISVQLTAGQHSRPLSAHEACVLQAYEDKRILAGVMANNLKQALDPVVFTMQPE